MDTSTQFWRDAALPYAESRRACISRACYKPHSHPTYSVGAIDQGQSLFSSEGGKPVILEPGTLVLVPADHVHSCNPRPGLTWSYQMLYLSAAWLAEVRAEYDGRQEAVRLIRSPAMYAKFCALNALLFSTSDVQEKEAALVEFVGDCDAYQVTAMDDLVPAASASPEQLLPVFEILRAAPTTNFSLELLARSARMSRYQLIRAFRSATGLTPHAWQLNHRVNLAKELIRAGESSARVAHTLGFADQAHFQRVFKAYAGITPGGFRA